MAKTKTPAAEPKTDAPASKKTACPVTRAEFAAGAKPVTVVIAGTAFVANPKEFSTGSFGYYCNGKVVIDIGGVPMTFQVGLNLTAVGSKDPLK